MKAAAAGAIAFLTRSEPVVLAADGAQRPTPATAQGEVPVVVELFTSEGCSSCPPADEVLARLEASQPIGGARVIPLAFHVDYWDELGWPDPFASPAFTARQRAYGRTYTPQAVVDGRMELVGSNAGGLERAIAKVATRSHASIEIASERRNGSFDVSVHVGPLPKTKHGADADATVLVALTQASTTVNVPRGENAGRSLKHTAIVRDLERAGSVGPEGGGARAALRPTVGIAEEQFRIVAFVQRISDHEILGSATRALSR